MLEEELYLQAIQHEQQLQMVITYSVLGTFIFLVILFCLYTIFLADTPRNRMKWRNQRRNKRRNKEEEARNKRASYRVNQMESCPKRTIQSIRMRGYK
jgi:Fe2+ transport system protein B